MTTTLAPALGRLAAAPSRPDDDLRLDLIDRLVAPGVAADGQAWVRAWRVTAEALAERVIAEATDDLQRAATHSRFPSARLARLLPDTEVRELLAERLAAEGMELERLAPQGDGSAVRRMRGAALEAAWDAALAVVQGERRQWRARAADVDAWRRPWRPLVVGGTMLGLVLLVAAAWIGGWMPAPTWFRPVIDAFWRLPWP